MFLRIIKHFWVIIFSSDECIGVFFFFFKFYRIRIQDILEEWDFTLRRLKVNQKSCTSSKYQWHKNKSSESFFWCLTTDSISSSPSYPSRQLVKKFWVYLSWAPMEDQTTQAHTNAQALWPPAPTSNYTNNTIPATFLFPWQAIPDLLRKPTLLSSEPPLYK